MKVYVNDEEVSLYRGMSVHHALSEATLKLVQEGILEVVDQYGHRVGLDGALSEGARLYTRRVKKEED